MASIAAQPPIQSDSSAGPNQPVRSSNLFSSPLTLRLLTYFTVLMLGAAAYMAFIYAPLERSMGAVQRIFYFHVGAAWAGALSFLITALAGVVYLATKNRKWDTVAESSVEVGLALLTMTLLSGPVWAASAWGQAWTLDPKLNSAAVMWLSYAAYLMLRQGIEDPVKRARFGAVYGLIAFSSVIMTYFGVRFIDTAIHPNVMGPSASTGSGDFGMAPRMLQAMIFSFITFSFVLATLLWHRIRLGLFKQHVEQVKIAKFSQEAF
ncbi:MAG: cytochrome c biogenesis protein CcsA [Chloroflexi bacterium]|nr:cytochrome c biogenesis protein CcsA [Chloroflexota bacterium]